MSCCDKMAVNNPAFKTPAVKNKGGITWEGAIYRDREVITAACLSPTAVDELIKKHTNE